MNFNNINFNTGDLIICYKYNNCILNSIPNKFVHTGIILKNPLIDLNISYGIYVLEYFNNRYQINKIDYIFQDYNLIKYVKFNFDKNIIFSNKIEAFIKYDIKNHNLNKKNIIYNRNKILRNLFYKKINLIKKDYSLNSLLKLNNFEKPIIIYNFKMLINNNLSLYEDL